MAKTQGNDHGVPPHPRAEAEDPLKRFELSDEEFKARYPALWRRRQKHAAKRLKLWERRKKRGVVKRALEKKKRRHQCSWTPEEDRILRSHWGEKSLAVLSATLQRTMRAVSHRAQRLKLGAASRADLPGTALEGAASLSEFSKHSGFERSAIKRVAGLLGIAFAKARASYPTRDSTGYVPQRIRTLAITTPQQTAILEILLKGRVSQPDRVCVECHRRKPHAAKSRCKNCYARYYRTSRKNKITKTYKPMEDP